MTGHPDAPREIVVVRGKPSTEELTAVIAVLAAAGGRGDRDARTGSPVGQWAAYWRAVRAPVRPGPDAWRQSGRTQ